MFWYSVCIMNNENQNTPDQNPQSYDDAVDQAINIVESGKQLPTELPSVEQPQPTEVEVVQTRPSRTELSRAQKVGVVAAGTIAAGVAALGLTKGVDAMSDKAAEYNEDRNQERVELVTDYRETGQVPEGKTVIEAPGNVNTAYDMAQQITSGEDTRGLTADIHAQSNAQGYPGVEPGTGEVYVVDTKDITPEAAEELAPKPEFNVPDGHTDVIQ